MNLGCHLSRVAARDAGRTALYRGREAYCDYGELARRAAVMAGQLAARFGLQPGDRVALALRNSPAFLEALYGSWHGGFAAVPMNAKLHAKEFAHILADSGARICLASPELAAVIAPEVEALESLAAMLPFGPDGAPEVAEGRRLLAGEVVPLVERAPGDLAWLFYTSGTTGLPKGAALTHRNLLAMTLTYFIDVDRIAPQDCILHAAPLSHGSGLYGLPHTAVGAAHVIPESGAFEPREIFELAEAHRGATLFAAPTMVKRLAGDPAAASVPLEGLKTVVYGGGPMYVADLKAAMARLGERFAQIYGQGESPMTITALSKAEHGRRDHPDYEARLASVGQAQSVVEVRVADAEDRALPTGEAGEVLVRGATVMPGYWNNPAASAETLRGGWLHTGDIGVMDAAGYLTLMDRSKDLIISGGANIYPREVEEVLLRHERVAEVAVVGRPHGEWGEEVVAFVVARPGEGGSVLPSPEALDAHCLEALARFKRPRHYRFVEALPKNNYGKVVKRELRDRLAAEAPEGETGA